MRAFACSSPAGGGLVGGPSSFKIGLGNQLIFEELLRALKIKPLLLLIGLGAFEIGDIGIECGLRSLKIGFGSLIQWPARLAHQIQAAHFPTARATDLF